MMAVWQYRSCGSFACHRNNRGWSKVRAHEPRGRVHVWWGRARAQFFRKSRLLHRRVLHHRCGEKKSLPRNDECFSNAPGSPRVWRWLSIITGWATGSFLGVFEGLRKARQAKLSQQLLMTSIINASGKRGASWGNNLGWVENRIQTRKQGMPPLLGGAHDWNGSRC